MSNPMIDAQDKIMQFLGIETENLGRAVIIINPKDVIRVNCEYIVTDSNGDNLFEDDGVKRVVREFGIAFKGTGTDARPVDHNIAGVPDQTLNQAGYK